MAKKNKVVFARVSEEAHEWALKKSDRKKGASISLVIERLLLKDKRKHQARAAA